KRSEWLGRVFPNLQEPLLTETAELLKPGRYAPGDAVVRQGEPPDALYIISHGQVRVVREDRPGHEVEIATLGPGQFFGEMALLAGATRTASVYASTNLMVLELGRVGFNRVVNNSPNVALASTDATAGMSPGLARQDDWVRVIHAACHAIVASHHA